MQELQRVIKSSRVAHAGSHDREELIEVFAEETGLERAFPCIHPVLVAANRVDLAVMCEVAERLREVPGRKSVGAVALMHQSESALEIRILHVGEKFRRLVRQEHALK